MKDNLSCSSTVTILFCFTNLKATSLTFLSPDVRARDQMCCKSQKLIYYNALHYRLMLIHYHYFLITKIGNIRLSWWL